MENQYKATVEGQEFQQADANAIGLTAAVADDRVLWEALRLLPFTGAPQKAILPYGVQGWAKPSGLSSPASTALVWGNTNDAKIKVMPFRLIVGSVTSQGTSPIESMRGITSAYFVGDGAQLQKSITINANSSGNPRWTLVYASVQTNASLNSVSRYVKDPTTKNVAAQTLATLYGNTVVVSTVDGTPGATPARPAVPADAGGAYNVPLAYLWVPNGFGPTSSINREYVDEVAPVITLHSSMGVADLQPANQQNSIAAVTPSVGGALTSGTVDTRQSGNVGAFRPGAYLPPTMSGGASRIILMQLGLAPASHSDGDVVDNSIDWRFRYFKWKVYAGTGATTAAAFASDRNLTGVFPAPSATNCVPGTSTADGFGQSLVDDTSLVSGSFAPGISDGNGIALYLPNSRLSAIGGGNLLVIYARNTDGALVVRKVGSIQCQLFVWLEATGPYSNFGVI